MTDKPTADTTSVEAPQDDQDTAKELDAHMETAASVDAKANVLKWLLKRALTHLTKDQFQAIWARIGNYVWNAIRALQ